MQAQTFTYIFQHLAKHPTIKLVYVDLFCGAGGTSTGVHKAKDKDGNQVAMVVTCVNHDAKAIASHAANHPNALHYVEDIKTLNLREITALIQAIRQRFPEIKVCLWASLECTNFSNAKGGGSRDADSRSLADHMPRYIKAINPDYFQVENVREFMAWGPLRIRAKTYDNRSDLVLKFNKKTNREEYVMMPENRKKGKEFLRWVQQIEGIGYVYSFRILNAADFGAFTSRSRYFALFAKPECSVAWPKQTHAKNPKSGLFGELKKWSAVRACLDLEDKGQSIFEREVPLVENTLRRIYAGLLKHVAKGDLTFLAKYYSGDDAGKCIGIDAPAGAMTTTDSHGLVNAEPFLMTYYSGSHTNRVKSLEEPCLTVTTENRHGVVSFGQDPFLVKYHGSEKESHGIDKPSGAITTKDRMGLVSTENFLLGQTSTAEMKPVDEPSVTLLTDCNNRMVSVESHYLVTTNHGGNTHSVEVPSPVVIASQHKAPISVISVSEGGAQYWIINESDSEAMIDIKRFMQAYQISNIYMRMLKVSELLPIQGFPRDYILKGSDTDKKKFIGNAVEVNVAAAWTLALATV